MMSTIKVIWILAVSSVYITLQLLPMARALVCSTDANCTLPRQTCTVRTTGSICECAQGYYFIQDRCKTSVGEICSSATSIEATFEACNINAITLLPLVLGSSEDQKCIAYLKLKPCVVSEIRKLLATCSVAEIADGVGKYANTAIQTYSIPPIDFSVLDNCQAVKIKVVLKLRRSYWLPALADTASPPYWFIMDKYDALVRQLLKDTFMDSFIDSSITYLRQGEGSAVLSEVAMQLTESTVANISDTMIARTIASNTNYSQWFSVESATASTAVSCTLDDLEYQADLEYQDGERFRSSDSCSRCLCNNGQVSCTSMTCTSVWIKEKCTSNSMCMTENAECNNVCVCKAGYMYNDETAICGLRKKDLGAICSNTDECEGRHVTCSNFNCSCISPYSVKTGETSCFVDLNQTCTADIDCRQTGASCTNGMCGCGDGYFETSLKCTKRSKVGDSCVLANDCNSNHMECRNMQCTCVSVAKAVNSMCVLEKTLGEPCTSTIECIRNAGCGMSGTCECNQMYTRSNSGSCVITGGGTSSMLGDSCVLTNQCNSKHMECRDMQCACVSGAHAMNSMCELDENMKKEDMTTNIIIIIVCVAVAVAIAMLTVAACLGYRYRARSRQQNMAVQRSGESNQGFADISMNGVSKET